MEVIFGGIFALLTKMIPDFIGIYKTKQSYEYELKMYDKQLSEAAVVSQQKSFEIDRISGAKEQSAAYRHDVAISKRDTGFLIALRSSVRPVITYAIFLLYSMIKLCVVLQAIQDDVSLLESFTSVWTDFDSFLATSIIGFWFCNQSWAAKVYNANPTKA